MLVKHEIFLFFSMSIKHPTEKIRIEIKQIGLAYVNISKEMLRRFKKIYCIQRCSVTEIGKGLSTEHRSLDSSSQNPFYLV